MASGAPPTVIGVHPFITAAVTFAAALAGSGTASAFVTTRAERRGRNDERVIADIRETQDRLRDLRRAFRLRAALRPDAPDDVVLADLVDALDTAANRTLCESVVLLVRYYAEVADEWSARLTETVDEAEQAAYDSAAETLRRELRRNR